MQSILSRMTMASVLAVAAVVLGAGTAVQAKDFYVSPEGSPDGQGTQQSPWDLESAVGGKQNVGAGDTIYLIGGTYVYPDRSHKSPGYVITLRGEKDRPVQIRPVPGAHVVIDGPMAVKGKTQYMWLRGLELVTHETVDGKNRQSAPPKKGQYSTLTVPSGGLNILSGKGCKYINLVIHDNASTGVGFWKGAIDSEIYGCLIYNNGWVASDRYHGPGIYTQNRDGTKLISDNMIFANYSTTIQAYGSKNAWVDHYQIIGNFAFDPMKKGGRQRLLVGGGKPSKDILVSENLCVGVPIQIGYGRAGKKGTDITVTDNTVIGSRLGIAPPAEVVTNRDNFVWKQGQPHPESPTIVLRPNKYDKNRANLGVINWTKQKQVKVAVKGFLADGQAYRLMDPYNFYGKPVTTGLVTDGQVTVPLNGAFSAYVVMGEQQAQ